MESAPEFGERVGSLCAEDGVVTGRHCWTVRSVGQWVVGARHNRPTEVK